MRNVCQYVSTLSAACLVGLGGAGCKDLTGGQQLPAGTVSPSAYNTPAGAWGMRTAALYALESDLPSYLVNTGLLTDELQSSLIGSPIDGLGSAASVPLDARVLPTEAVANSGGSFTDWDRNYEGLQRIRGKVNQALGAIAVYDTGAQAIGDRRVARGELFALKGYVEVLLASEFCSGVPLSTWDFAQDFTYQPSSTTAQVYLDAIAQEDSALALADTSSQVKFLASVLKGRAFLALDSVAAAARAVTDVPEGFQYVLAIPMNNLGDESTSGSAFNDVATVSDQEGRNGLPYRSSLDPRVATSQNGTNMFGRPLFFPARYSMTNFSAFPVADWIEARLIQAEAAARGVGSAGSMIDLLAQLRATASVAGLPGPYTYPESLVDPGTGQDSARVALVFRERAYWLFLTGHRQEDLRRLLRQFPQWYPSQARVYPTGGFPVGRGLNYGSDVTAPIPYAETINPLFHGCLNRNP